MIRAWAATCCLARKQRSTAQASAIIDGTLKKLIAGMSGKIELAPPAEK
jgi:hypothetical protein